MRFWLIGLLLLVAPRANAQEPTPPPPPIDPRIRIVTYDPGTVIPLRVVPGYQLTLEFAADEMIENVAVGDSSGWQVTANKRGDRLFVKPAAGSESTNMTVMTDQRSYVFDLSAGNSGSPIYILRFSYPGEVKQSPAEAPSVGPGRYRLTGTRAIRPDAMSDDGRKTYIVWRPSQTLPAVFAIGRDGQETLTDGAMIDGQFVINGVVNRLVFRLDKALATAVRMPQVKH